MLLHERVVERIGPQAVRLGNRVMGYRKNFDGSVTARVEHPDGSSSEAKGALLVGADGIHSAVRAQMHRAQPPIHWGGAVMWRGVTWAKPIRTGSSFVGIGTHRQRMVFYPISHPDRQTGLAMINWIAEVTMDNSEGWKHHGWFRQVGIDDFIQYFDDWVWDWLDVPALITQAGSAFENPMIDRDPVPTWQDGPAVLIGDAAHAMYPTGSNGGSQAIVDARILGAAMVEYGVTQEALAAR
jgi:2-polyprenyl-6-methoxyphenol hydroxylase-like FAD-dependent oxidoreductase